MRYIQFPAQVQRPYPWWPTNVTSIIIVIVHYNCNYQITIVIVNYNCNYQITIVNVITNVTSVITQTLKQVIWGITWKRTAQVQRPYPWWQPDQNMRIWFSDAARSKLLFLRSLTSGWRPFGPALGPSGLLDFVLCALRGIFKLIHMTEV